MSKGLILLILSQKVKDFANIGLWAGIFFSYWMAWFRLGLSSRKF